MPTLMSCWKEDRNERYLKLIAVVMIAGFLVMFGALLRDLSHGPNEASRAQFERLMLLEQERSG